LLFRAQVEKGSAMLSSVFRSGLTAVFVMAAVSSIGRADIAPQGQHLEPNVLYSHPNMPAPVGKYRTRYAWLTASMIAKENLGYFESLGYLMVTPALYQDYFSREKTYFTGLNGTEHYLYIDAMVRDFAKMQIFTLENSRMGLAQDAFQTAIFADVITGVLSEGVTWVPPQSRQGIGALQSRFLERSTQLNVMGRFKVTDLELRYRGFVDTAIFAETKRQIASGVSADDAIKLLVESITSAGIGAAVNSFDESPSEMLDMFRTQLVMDVATYGCADVQDRTVTAAMLPSQATVLQGFWGSQGDYLTPLAMLISLQSSPTAYSPINLMSGTTIRGQLSTELASLRQMERDKPAQYGIYMRRLLIDLETIEKAEIANLQSGATMEFIESASLNVLFGAFASATGGSLGAQVVFSMANAGYSAFDTYNSVSDEMRVRMQVAGLREIILDKLKPLSNTCGFGSGLVIVPETTVQGAPPAN